MISFITARFSKILWLMVALLFMPGLGRAALGDLDVSFGVGGIVDTGLLESGKDVAIQTDGKVVVAGAVSLTRYNVDGTIDLSFGNSGVATTTSFTLVEAIALQNDGKILVAGKLFDPLAQGYDFALARYNSSGTVDVSFGNGGSTIVDLGGGIDTAYAISIQSDGKILLAGYGKTPLTFVDVALVRFNIDGTLDTTFGTSGIVLAGFSGGTDIAYDMTIQPDGKILVAGSGWWGVWPQRMMYLLARFNTDGTLDTAFGTSGHVFRDFGVESRAYGVNVQADGKILVAGTTDIFSYYTSNIAVVRYNSDGTLDTGFGSGGTVITDFGSNLGEQGFDVVSQVDGRILVAGYTIDPVNSDKEFALVRYNSDGTLDAGFGVGGLVTTDLGANTSDSANAMALQPDGKIILVGDINTYGIAIARYVGAVAPVPDIKVNGQDVALSLLMGNSVSIDIALLANGLTASNADIFVGVLTSNGNYWLRPSGNWVPGNPAQAYFTGPLTDIPLTNVLTYTLPWRGVYTFFIIVDAVGNNTFDNMSYVDTGLVIMGDTPPLALSHTAMQNEIKAKIRSLMTK